MKENTFKDYNLSNEILKALELLNYNKPTLIQQKVIPEVLKGKDLRVQSQTGSGKTAAFGIPICEVIDWLENAPQALILVPTRELALQVSEEISNIGRLKRIKAAAIFGKVSLERQEIELKQKTHIVVGTPGRVRDLILRGSFPIHKIKYLVIDEADEMFHIGLKEQVEDIIKTLPLSRSTFLFSATLSEEINELAECYMHEPMDISMEEELLPTHQITQSAYLTAMESKMETLKYSLTKENPDNCIIFANTQVTVDEIYRHLSGLHFPCSRLHGGLLQKERIKIMNQFKSQEFRYLITTDVAARGIDIDNINLVINYDMPRGNENYVHRIGRTGRKDNYGKALTFYTEKERNKLSALEEFTQVPILREIIEPEEITISEKELFQEKIHQKLEKKEKKDANLNESITKLHINAGKKSKIRANEIVATICSVEGVFDTDIGIITITEIATFVDILNNKGNYVLKELQKKTIKGKVRKVHIARKS